MNIRQMAVYLLIASVSLLALLAVLSIWGVLNDGVLWKSISTIGVFAFASLVIITASFALDGNKGASGMLSDKRKAELRQIARDAFDDSGTS